MKIALMAPAGAMHRYNGSFSKALHYAPLTLTTLAALVPEELEAHIDIYDETVEYLPKELDADIIGMTVITGTSQRCYKWADYYRSKGITVILGGVHPTLLPQEAKEHADSVVVGYAEQTWPKLLRDFRNKQLKSFYYMEDSFTLKGRPIPRRDLLKKEKYITTNSVEATRGCVHSCEFCVAPALNGNNVYVRPVNEVIDEIECFPGNKFIFVDINLIAIREYAKSLFKALIPLKKQWFGLVTSYIGKDDELLKLMRESGCRGVLIGFESVSELSLKSINKPFNKIQDYKELVRKLHDAGIAINGTFVLGTDADQKDVFERTYELVQNLRIDLPRFSMMTPFPNTGLYKELAREGRILENDWSLYDVQHCVIRPKMMTASELQKGFEWIWNKTYEGRSIFQRIFARSNLYFFNIPTNIGYRMYAKKHARFPKEIMKDHSDIPTYEEDNVYLSGHR